MFLVVLLVAGVTGDLVPTTTKTYDLEVPGADPIRIVEGEPLWKTASSKYEHRSFNTRDESDDKNDPLHQFLTTYADSVRRNKNKNKEEEESTTEKGKSWDLVQFQRHNHPYDDKKGWVSMEPVPWSVSKISKWQSKYKPSNSRPWDEYESEEHRPIQPTTNNYDIYFLDERPDSRPAFNKPTAVYNQKVHVNYATPNRYQQHTHDDNCKHTRPQKPQRPMRPLYDDGEILTDGLPANFPQPYESNRRQGTDMHPDTHPLSGDGEWVLLSTTKGYKYPQKKQRALQINPDAIGAHRGVRLTVLPPLKNSKVNMTTSHGGLLQVESTFQTVEQAHRQYTKKQKLKKLKKKQKPIQQVAAPTVTTTMRKGSGPDSSAVLAAVGAGMIPATMAMLVPMALGGRRKRDMRFITSTAKYLQETLPRNL